MEISMSELEWELLHFGALSPSPESMPELSASLWGFPRRTWVAGGWGKRDEGSWKVAEGGEQAEEAFSDWLWMLCNFCSSDDIKRLFFDIPTYLLWLRMAFIIHIGDHHSGIPGKSCFQIPCFIVLTSTFTLVRQSLGIMVLQLMGMVSRAPQFQFTGSS